MRLNQTGAVRVNAAPRRSMAAAIPMQAKTEEQDVEFNNRMACSKCQITYYSVIGEKAQCPLCDAERRILELQTVIHGQRNQLEVLESAAGKMRVDLDIVEAIRQAVDTISSEDLAFLKSVVYRYRADPTGIGLRATHGSGGKGKKAAVNGFIAIPRGGEPEAYICNSIGGVAIGGYFEEMLRAAGDVRAIALLMRGLSQVLAVGRS